MDFYKKHKVIGVVLPQLFLGLLLYSCATYHLSNGEKFRNWFPVNDEYVIDQSELEKNKFDITLFTNPDSSGRKQYIFPTDLYRIADSVHKDLLVIFYFPNCGAADKEVEIAKFAEDNNIPVILISDTYSPVRMLDLYKKHNLRNKNQYIIPTVDKHEDLNLKKKLQFIKDVKPQLHETLKDDLIFASLMIVSRDGNAEVNPLSTNGFGTKPFLINWIKEKYRLTQ